MARPLRIEFPGAVYHITSRGNAGNPMLTLSWILSKFGKNEKEAGQAYKEFVLDGLKNKPEIMVRSGLWIGSEAFGRSLKGKIGDKAKVAEYPRRQRRVIRRKLLKEYFPAHVLEELSKRNDAIFRAYREGRYSQRAIGKHLGLHYVTISVVIRRIENEKLSQMQGEKSN